MSRSLSTTQITFRVPNEWVTNADRILAQREKLKLARDGVALERTDVYRLAMAAGFKAFLGELE